MNRSLILYFTGRLICIEALLMLLPAAVAALYREDCLWAFVAVILPSLLFGRGLSAAFTPKNKTIYAREGFVIVALSWLVFSAIGALPFVISGEIPSYVDAFFETVSGFTTTGASILPNVETMSRGLLFWRSFTHWIGGMGILVFIVALLPGVSDRSIHILKAEMPGPIMGKLVPRLKDTARVLYLIYIVMTVAQIILMFAGGMPLFDSVVHAFGTAGTGGFGIKADSIASYSPYLQWVITIFMLLFGINFNLYFLLLRRRLRDALRSTEVWVYLGIVLVAVGLITWNTATASTPLADTVRYSAFQVSSIITTTGFATTDFNLWPAFSKIILLLLMFIGACAGSTGGGLKVSRAVILFQSIKQEFRKLIHPRSVSTVTFEGKPLDKTTLSSVKNYFALYILCFAAIFLAISWEPMSIESHFSAAAACFNNIGPGLDAVGPTQNFACYSPLSKLVLSFAMLLGRLEIFPLLLAFAPSTWLKNK